MPQTSPRMLEGYRALDFIQVLAGPTTTRYVAELGAVHHRAHQRGDPIPISRPHHAI